MWSRRRVTVGGPYFEDLEHGQVFDAPALTLTSGHAALHQAIAGDRHAPAARRAAQPRGDRRRAGARPPEPRLRRGDRPVHRARPSACCGNLFYRGLVLLRPVFIGDTLRTRTEVVALKQNRPRAGRQRHRAGGAADPDREPARRAGARLLALPDDPAARPRRRDRPRRRLRRDPGGARPGAGRAAVPATGTTRALRERLSASTSRTSSRARCYAIEGRDTVTSAPELARLTLNVAMTHRDAGAGAHGRRLVYGGHTISVAAAQATRALPEPGDDRRLAQLRPHGAGVRGRRAAHRARR